MLPTDIVQISKVCSLEPPYHPYGIIRTIGLALTLSV